MKKRIVVMSFSACARYLGLVVVSTALCVSGCLPTHLVLQQTEKEPSAANNPREVSPEAYSLYCKGNTERLALRWRTAIKYFEEALQYDPQSTMIRQRLVQCYSRLGDKYRDKVFELTKSLVELDPDDFDYNFLLARLYDEQNETDKAIVTYRKCIDSLSEDPMRAYAARLKLADLYCRTGQVKDAIPVLEELIKIKPAGEIGYTLYYTLGRSYYVDRQYDKAISCFKNCLKLDPAGNNKTTLDIHWQLGAAYESLYPKGGGSAIHELEAMLKLHPKSDPLKYWLAWFQEKAGQSDKAIGSYLDVMKARKGNPDDKILLFVYRSLSRLYEQTGQKEKGMELLKQIELVPSKAELRDRAVRALKRSLRVQLVFLYDNNDMDEKVVPLLRKIIAADPDNASANNYLAYWFAEKNTNLDESIELVQKALKLEPENGAYIDTLAWAYYRKATIEGDESGIRKALDELLRARHSYNKEREERGETPVDDPVILDHIADVYFALGQWDEAKKFYQASLATAAQLSEERPDALPNPDYVRLKLSRVKRLLAGEPASPPAKPPGSP